MKKGKSKIDYKNVQFKNKERISKYGEVFTSQREVNEMIDLVSHEAIRLESRFLEQACGEGVFLMEVLSRKLDVISKKFKRHKQDFVKNTIIAVSSLYGIDLLIDNVEKCRDNLLKITLNKYKGIFKDENEKFIKTIKFILSVNIVCGNCLTMKDNNGEFIIFSEWSPLNDLYIKRTEYLFSELIDSDKDFFIPKELKEYKPIKYFDIGDIYE